MVLVLLALPKIAYAAASDAQMPSGRNSSVSELFASEIIATQSLVPLNDPVREISFTITVNNGTGGTATSNTATLRIMPAGTGNFAGYIGDVVNPDRNTPFNRATDITSDDVFAVTLYVAGFGHFIPAMLDVGPDDFDMRLADIDGDGQVTNDDAFALTLFVAGFEHFIAAMLGDLGPDAAARIGHYRLYE
jgi:hypothetical protein